MKIGFFHPTINGCGGAEFVSVKMINCLAQAGYKTVIMANEKIDQSRMQQLFGCRVEVSSEVIFPFELFPITDLHNVYGDVIRTRYLKSKCDIVIDTHSNALMPFVDITYIHFPLFGRIGGLESLKNLNRLNKIYFKLYSIYEQNQRASNRLILANSVYTSNAIRKIVGVSPILLYPPVSDDCFTNTNFSDKQNIAVCLSRISPEKRLTLIPEIAKRTDDKLHFLIIGINQSPLYLSKLLKLIKEKKLQNKVEVLTDVPREKLVKILKAAKILVHVAEGEHFGVCIAEAMASGCVPIVHNSGGPTGFVSAKWRFNTVEEAADKINCSLTDWSPSEAERIAKQALVFSQSMFYKNFLKSFEEYANLNNLR
jgi:glycosyltransferase involved in cell wall biosynthesis